jgi:hypothetical protein
LGTGADIHDVRSSPSSRTSSERNLTASPPLQFTITTNNTAVVLAYVQEPYDLSSSSIPDGTILNNIVQEVNMTTGERHYDVR